MSDLDRHVVDEVMDYLEGRLPPERVREIHDHVASCEDCAGDLDAAVRIYEGFLVDGRRHLSDSKIVALGSDLGYETTPVEALHLERCADCRAKYEWARSVTPPREGDRPRAGGRFRGAPRRWTAGAAAVAAVLLLALFGRGRLGPRPEDQRSRTPRPALPAATLGSPREFAVLEPIPASFGEGVRARSPVAARAWAQYAAGDFAPAGATLAAAPDLISTHDDVALLRGSAELLAGNARAAIPFLETSIRRSTVADVNEEAHWQIANAYLELGYWEAALAALDVVALWETPRGRKAAALSRRLRASGWVAAPVTATDLPALFYAESHAIGWMNGDGWDARLLLTGDGSPRQMALDVGRRHLYFADALRPGIYRCDLSGENETLVVDGVTKGNGVALDLERGWLFWTEGIPGSIRRARLDGSERRTVLEGLNIPRHLAIDVDRRLLYWAEHGGEGRVARTDYEGSFVDVLHEGERSAGIALDLAGGKVYWADYANGRIVRADLDGANVEILLTLSDDPRPTSVTFHDGVVYWTEQSPHLLRRADVTTRVPETVRHLGDSGYFALVDPRTGGHRSPVSYARLEPVEGFLQPGGELANAVRGREGALERYREGAWDAALASASGGDAGAAALLAGSAALLAGRSGEAVHHLEEAIRFASSSQEEVEARWQLANAHLARGEAAAAGRELRRLVDGPRDRDARDLIALLAAAGVESPPPEWTPRPRLILSQAGVVERFSPSGADTVLARYDVAQIAIDADGGRLFWIDETGAAVALGLDETEPTRLFDTGARDWGGVAFDPEGGRLYWSDRARGTIESSRLDGADRRTLVGDLASPRHLAVDRLGRRLYWTDEGTGAETADGRIGRVALRTGEQEVLLTGLGAPYGLEVDEESRALLWTEGTGHAVRRAGLDGQGVSTLVELPADEIYRPTGMAVAGGLLYWSERGTRVIRRAGLDGAGVETVRRCRRVVFDVVVDPRSAGSPAAHRYR